MTAYAITDGDYSTAGTQISTTACNGGGVCLLGQVGLVELFQGLIVATKIRVFYQRKTGAEDTEFAVALPWVGFPNHDTMTTFQSCVYKLLQIP